MLNKGIAIESWNENTEAIVEMLACLDCIDIITTRLTSELSMTSARTSLIGLFRIFKATFNRPEFKVYWSF